MLVAPVLFPVLVVLLWGCWLPLLVLPWPAPLLPVVPAPEPLLVPLPVLVVGLLASRLFKPWRGLSLGPRGLTGAWKSGPGPDDFETPTPPLLPLLLLVVCEGVPP